MGNGGNDTINSGTANDTIVGGVGNDGIINDITSTGATFVYGNEGNDNINMAAAAGARTTVIGGQGNDSIIGSSNTAPFGTGDLIFGNEDSDTISASDGNDTVYGGSDSNADGGAGDAADAISPGAGNDLIFGGNGNDTITGGLNVDTMSGGNGADQFFISPNLEDGVVGNSGSTVDFITDANWAEDVIHTCLASAAVDTVSATVEGQVNAAATLSAAVALVAGAGAGQIGLTHIGTFTYQGDTYLLQNNVAAGFVDAEDLLIRVTGATGTLSTANVTV